MFQQFMEAWRSKNLLKQALERTAETFEVLSRSYEVVREHVVEGTPVNVDIYGRDRYVNHLNREIRRLIAEHLVLKPGENPIACLVLLNVNIDLERCGDYMKNIYEVALSYGQPLKESSYRDGSLLIELSRQVQEEFIICRTAFLELDKEKASELHDVHSLLSKEVGRLIRELFDDPSLGAKEAVMASLLSRYFKRISAHLENVASTVLNPFDWVSYRFDGDKAEGFKLD